VFSSRGAASSATHDLPHGKDVHRPTVVAPVTLSVLGRELPGGLDALALSQRGGTAPTVPTPESAQGINLGASRCLDIRLLVSMISRSLCTEGVGPSPCRLSRHRCPAYPVGPQGAPCMALSNFYTSGVRYWWMLIKGEVECALELFRMRRVAGKDAPLLDSFMRSARGRPVRRPVRAFGTQSPPLSGGPAAS
jgi:hypothetical protein